MVHAHLRRDHLVYVKSGSVHCSIPVRFKSYQKFRDEIEKKRRQLCNVVDSIVEQGPESTETEEYRVFREYPLGCETM